MLITTLFKTIDRRNFIICGHLSKQEIASLRDEGWRKEKPSVNKNGIPLEKLRRKHS